MPARKGTRYPIDDELRAKLNQAASDQKLKPPAIAELVNDYYRRTKSDREPVDSGLVERVLTGKVNASAELPAIRTVLGVLEDTASVTTFNRDEIELLGLFRAIRELDGPTAAAAMDDMRERLSDLQAGLAAEEEARRRKERARGPGAAEKLRQEATSASATSTPVPAKTPR